MSFLLDTNAVSEWQKPLPDPGFATWFAAIDEDSLFLSVVTLAELRFGVERLPASRRRTRLQTWLEEDLTRRFAGRVLGVDSAVAHVWGRLAARAAAAGRAMGDRDAILAATAQAAGLTVVTRNVRDFAVTGTPVLNPWVG